MDKQYLVNQLKLLADRYHVSIDEETLGEIISQSSFRVVSKGEILSSIGDDTTVSGMVLSGLARCYYIDKDGNDITRGFAAAGYLCMDEGFFGYQERLCMWETLEESTVMLCKTAVIRQLSQENVSFKDVWITLLEKPCGIRSIGKTVSLLRMQPNAICISERCFLSYTASSRKSILRPILESHPNH